MRFDIQPYVGALPIVFEMPRESVHRLLGLPEASVPIWNGSGVTEHYAGFNVGYDNSGTVTHVGFTPGSVELTIQAWPIWDLNQQPDPNPVLLTLDPGPVEVLGFWVYLRIGVTTTGYHDDDPNQRAITVFPPENKGEWLAGAQPAYTGKYQH